MSIIRTDDFFACFNNHPRWISSCVPNINHILELRSFSFSFSLFLALSLYSSRLERGTWSDALTLSLARLTERENWESQSRSCSRSRWHTRWPVHHDVETEESLSAQYDSHNVWSIACIDGGKGGNFSIIIVWVFFFIKLINHSIDHWNIYTKHEINWHSFKINFIYHQFDSNQLEQKRKYRQRFQLVETT